jgi:glycosyltransferase involved in cell wall biosynthesis
MINFGISVILPVYFRQSTEQNYFFLKRALKSIEAQKFPAEYEVLLIDDGSPAPVTLPKSLYGSIVDKVNIIRLKVNLGLVNALNIGLKNAKYPLIARMDADDWWNSNKIESQISCFQKDSDLTLVATGMTRYSSDEKIIDTHIRNGKWDEILDFFIEVGCPFPHGSILAKKEIFELLGLYPHDARFSHCEDFALWGVWLRFFKAKIIEESLYNYTVWDHSISHSHSSQQQIASRVVMDSFSASVNRKKMPSALIDLSRVLNISILQAGKLAYFFWRFHIKVALPNEAIQVLAKIIPDRIFISESTSETAKNWFEIIKIPECSIDHKKIKVVGSYYSV